MPSRRWTLFLVICIASLSWTTTPAAVAEDTVGSQSTTAASRRLPRRSTPNASWQPDRTGSSAWTGSPAVPVTAASATYATEPVVPVGTVQNANMGLPVPSTPAEQLVAEFGNLGGTRRVTAAAYASPTVQPMPQTVLPDEAIFVHPDRAAPCGGGCGDGCAGGCDGSQLFGGGCNTPGCGGPSNWGPEILPGLGLDHLSIFGGVQSVKNAANRGQDSSFGFHEGFNFGTFARNIIFPPTVGLQFGLQANQSNFNGSSFTTQDRNQFFFTTGAFRRGDHGLQGGLVLDYLWDNWYYDDLQVAQLRGEVSVAVHSRFSYGLRLAVPIQDDDVMSRVNGQDLAETWETMDIYTLFFRTRLLGSGTGEATLFAGLTGDSDGIIGGQSQLPLTNGFALESEFTYLIPDEPSGFGGNEAESWNVAVGLAWYPGSLACGECFRYHRPMFDVANNGSMILKRK